VAIDLDRWPNNHSSTGQALQQAIWLDNYPVALINAPAAVVPEVAYIHLTIGRPASGRSYPRCSQPQQRILLREGGSNAFGK